MQTETAPTWNFNTLFEKYPMEEAIKKASEMERERASWSHMPLLEELYRPGWKEWESMPGAEVIRELASWEEGVNRDNKGEPWFPKIHANPYIWSGELKPEQLREVEYRQYTNVTNSIPSTAFSTVRAYLDGNKELRQLANWWHFDEETHEEMKERVLVTHFGYSKESMQAEARKQLELLKSEETKRIGTDTLKAVNRFAALRDGPAILVGGIILQERENMWTSQKSRVALQKHYGYSNDALLFVNIHTYIDVFHVRLGEYIIGKYARTKEEQEMVKLMFKSQKTKQMQRSKDFYDKLFRGENRQITKEDIDGNIG
jgi:hypothetical protein